MIFNYKNTHPKCTVYDQDTQEELTGVIAVSTVTGRVLHFKTPLEILNGGAKAEIIKYATVCPVYTTYPYPVKIVLSGRIV
jgi:hypothetical protein